MFLEELNALYFYTEDFIRRYTKIWDIAVNVKQYIGDFSHFSSVCAEL